jgi:folate-binding protein YgfZ
MSQDWKAFLNESNVSFIDISTASQKEMLFDLSNKGLIKVSGEDAESFLQNQLTNDIRNVTETTHQASAWCSPKGRIIANFQIFKRDDSYFLTVSADLLEHVIKKLRMYVMMSKVTLEDATESTAHFGYVGELQKFVDAVPVEAGQVIQTSHLSILKLSDSESRYEIFAGCSDIDDADNNCIEVKQLWKQCADNTETVNSNGWNYLNILAGLPNISEASSEAWIPQMVNYIAVDGVDFKKGCYPGQEVVARLNYLGKTKRRMYRLLIKTKQLPAIGDAISSDSDKAAGKILNVALNPDGTVEALAIMKIAEVEKNLTLATDEKITISLLSLPYSVDDE